MNLYVFIYIYFQLTPMLLVWEFHVCIWRGTLITLLQFFFLLCIGFYNITIIIIIVIIIKAAKRTTKVVFSPFTAFSQFKFKHLTSLCFCQICPQRKTKPIYSSENNVINLVCSRLVTESLTGSSWPIKSFKNVLLPTPLLPTTATVKKCKEMIRYRTWMTRFRTHVI